MDLTRQTFLAVRDDVNAVTAVMEGMLMEGFCQTHTVLRTRCLAHPITVTFGSVKERASWND